MDVLARVDPQISKKHGKISSWFNVAETRPFIGYGIIHLPSLKLTFWSWAPLYRPPVVRAPDGTRRLNTEFTRALHLFLSWATPIQSTLPHPTSPRSILILSTYLHLGLPSGLFPSGFPTNNLYAFCFSLIRATCHTHLILLDLLGGFPVTTSWRVLGLRMEERPPAMEDSCEYIE
jgi:hypothetical protein